MTTNQFLRKLSKGFDEKYGTEWESREIQEMAVNHSERERKLNKLFDVLRMVFMSETNKEDVTLKMNNSLSKVIIQFKRDLSDPYLPEVKKKESEIILSITTDIQNYINELYKNYRLVYPMGTEAEPVPVTDEMLDGKGENYIPKDEWLTAQQVADMLGLKIETLYEKVRKREIPSYKPGKLILFKPDDITEWIKKTKKKSYDELDTEANKKMKRQ